MKYKTHKKQKSRHEQKVRQEMSRELDRHDRFGQVTIWLTDISRKKEK